MGNSQGSSAAVPQHGHPVKNFVAGDPLRAIAALWVVLLHVGAATLWTTGQSANWDILGHWPGMLISAGGAGVKIFFVLSGYLISRPFVRAFKGEGSFPRLGRYVAARALRIYPAFWTVLIAAIIIGGTFHDISLEMFFEMFFLLKFDGTNPFAGQLAPVGTLPIEVWFYIALPILALLLWPISKLLKSRRTRIGLLCFLAVALWAFGIGMQLATGTDRNLVIGSAGFAPGILLAVFEPLAPRWAVSRKAGYAWLVIAATGFIIMLLGSELSLFHGQWWWQTQTVPAAALVGGLLMYQRATGGAPRLLDNKPMHWLGQRSYGIYIFHFLVISVCANWALDPNAWKLTYLKLAFATLTITICAADLSWRWIETPALNLRARITDRPIGRATPKPQPGDT